MYQKVLLILLILETSCCAYVSRICAEVPNGYFVRSSQSCNAYNRCINGQPTHGLCPKGRSFSPITQTCDNNIDVDCRACSPFGIQNIPHPDSCSMYYRCASGIRTTMTCSSGLLFDRYYGDCNVARSVICEAKNTICEPFVELSWLGMVKIGNPLDCSSYYYCLNGNAIEAVCPNGLFYNPYTATCEVLDTTNFCQGIGPIITTPIPERTTREALTTQSTARTTVRIVYVTKPPATSTQSTTRQTTTAGTSSSSSSTTTAATTVATTPTTTEATTTEQVTEEITEETTTTEGPATPAPPPVLVCEENVTGYFPYPPPDNCTRYYYCSRGLMRFTYTCNSGLFFMPGDNQCRADVPPGCEHLVE